MWLFKSFKDLLNDSFFYTWKKNGLYRFNRNFIQHEKCKVVLINIRGKWMLEMFLPIIVFQNYKRIDHPLFQME